MLLIYTPSAFRSYSSAELVSKSKLLQACFSSDSVCFTCGALDAKHVSVEAHDELESELEEVEKKEVDDEVDPLDEDDDEDDDDEDDDDDDE